MEFSLPKWNLPQLTWLERVCLNTESPGVQLRAIDTHGHSLLPILGALIWIPPHLRWTEILRGQTCWDIVTRMFVSFSHRLTSAKKSAPRVSWEPSAFWSFNHSGGFNWASEIYVGSQLCWLLGLCVEKYFLNRSGKGLWSAIMAAVREPGGVVEWGPWTWPLGFLWNLVLGLTLRLFSFSYDPYFPRMVPRKAPFQNSVGSNSWKWFLLIWCEVSHVSGSGGIHLITRRGLRSWASPAGWMLFWHCTLWFWLNLKVTLPADCQFLKNHYWGRYNLHILTVVFCQNALFSQAPGSHENRVTCGC